MDGTTDGEIALLVTTVSEEADAAHLARLLVSEGLAACVTRMPGVHSVYRWKGQVEEADEIVLVVKTTKDRLHDARAYLLGAHPYALPEVLESTDIRASAPYAAWVRENVRSTPTP